MVLLDVVDDAQEAGAKAGSVRAQEWASTMSGFTRRTRRLAHAQSNALLGDGRSRTRLVREEQQDAELAPGATRAIGAGTRAREEEADEFRTCFERDRDRILHSTAFRRLAGKTQVFVFPDDHQRTRLTHALEVSQVACAIADALSLNVALTEAIALGHDCGHGPGGHASEDAFTPYVDGGYDHAVFGADVVMAPLNLTVEVLDGIRNHSWSRPAPSTPEGEVVSWADRIAYVCHDFEDAVSARIVTPDLLPASVRQLGPRRSSQLSAFIDAVIRASFDAGEICMDEASAEALGDFRRFNYEHVYLRPDSKAQAESVIAVLQALVEHFADQPLEIPAVAEASERGESVGDSSFHAVQYVAGMTDRYAFELASARLGWPIDRLPRGIDVTPRSLAALRLG